MITRRKAAAPGALFQNQISYAKIGSAIFSRWYWWLASFILSFLFGTLYLYYRSPIYLTAASAKIEDRRSELSELTSLKNIYDKSNKIESEKFLIKSRTVMMKALHILHQDVSFLKREKFRYADLYPLRPVWIQIIKCAKYDGSVFEYKPINDSAYSLSLSDRSIEHTAIFRYGQLVSLQDYQFIIHKPRVTGSQKYFFRFNEIEQKLTSVLKRLSIEETQATNILSLKFIDQNPYFARDLLNTVLKQYFYFDKSQRSSSIMQTELFIGSLLVEMSNAVRQSGTDIEIFKTKNKVLDISSSIEATTNTLAQLQTQKKELDLNTAMTTSFEDRIKNLVDDEILDIGFQESDDPFFNTLITKYNDAVTRKKMLLKSYTSKLIIVKNVEEEIKATGLLIKKTTETKIKDDRLKAGLLNKNIDSILTSMAALPALERKFVKLQSQFEVDRKIHEFLSEKKLEAQISRAAITPAATIIDHAYLPMEITSPVPGNVYTLCAIASLALSTLLFIASRMLNPYVYNTKVIENYTEVPILGVIRKCSPKTDTEKISILDQPRSIFSESIRSIRTGLSFMASGKKNKIICITSEAPGEGKSFVSLNLAASINMMQKKVLLIATDMRKSRLHQSFGFSNADGLSKYLSGQCDLHQVIKQTSMACFDFIPSGPVPPNPSELLLDTRMELLLNELRDAYDFIILDSAPVGIVADGKPLINLSDINLFILRYGVSRQESILSPAALQKQLGLSNFAIILNDYEDDRFRNDLYNQMPTENPYHYSNQSYGEYHKYF